MKYYFYLSLQLLFAVVCTTAQPDINESTLEKIDKCITDSVGSKYVCSVLISVNGNIVLKNDYGIADTKSIDKPGQSLIFNIASITKSITAQGILNLRESGLLDLNDTIGKFLVNVPADKKKITIHQLLTHTSGLQQNYVTQFIASRDSAAENILNDTLAFEPGAKFSYSNENTELLAAIIEIVSGRSYESFIRESVLMPYGMSNTYFWHEAFEHENSRIAFIKKELPGKKRDWGYIGSGGIFSNTTDLFKFFLEIQKLPDNLKNLIFNDHYKLESGLIIGYSWFISKTAWGTEEYWTRGTEDFGHNAVIRWFPDDNNTVIIICTTQVKCTGPPVLQTVQSAMQLFQ